MSKELIADCLNWLRRRTADPYEQDAADIIEKQQKRIEELEAELVSERCLSFRTQVGELEEQIRHLQMALADTEALEMGTGERLAAAQAEVAHWKNNHETEVRRARTLKERTDMSIERVQAYEKWGEDQRQLAAAQKRIELYEQALKASWPEGAMGDAFDYWNAARRDDV